MDREIKSNSVYRYYKGNLYYVIGTAMHSETEEIMVVYHTLYGDNGMFVRPYKMFVSEVEEGKENKTGQKYRFELFEMS